jgi:hypothetical protein
MKTQTLYVIILIFILFYTSGCGSKLDHYANVRDLIMVQSGESFHTTFELAVKTDNLGIIQNYVRDIDIDTEDYEISNIEKVEIGIYKVEPEQKTKLVEKIVYVDVKKINRKLKRAGYETVAQNITEDEVSLGLIKESGRKQNGVGYFILIKQDDFILVKVDADFKRISD